VLGRSALRQIEVYDLVWSEQAAQALLQSARGEETKTSAANSPLSLAVTSAVAPVQHSYKRSPRKLVLDAQSLSPATLGKLVAMPNLTALEVNSFPELSPGTLLASPSLQRLHAGAHSLPLLSALHCPNLTHLASFRDAYVGNYPRAHSFAELIRLLIAAPRLTQLQLTVAFSDWTSDELANNQLPALPYMRDLEIYWVHGCRDLAIKEFVSRAQPVLSTLVRHCPNMERFVCSAQHQHTVPLVPDKDWDAFLANPRALCPNMKRMYVSVNWAQTPLSWIP